MVVQVNSEWWWEKVTPASRSSKEGDVVVDDCIMKGDSGQHSPSTLRSSEGGVVVVNGGG